ncbi:hypothetical protein [Lysinibacillus sp. SGAir0095]|uniref:hypothetical protein n=1 Tax=Lysinibacillus sp. SGAir0095 TaxID=2070463 RepID=UPI0010CCD745|nr:hypothetical protein [Lysinibacillus sp. SGAir0095]QCR33033.1 hypothetical protein C1N55_12975 [Lysinibacillus sp. SGAir0095]
MKFPNVIGRRELRNAAVIGSIAGLAGVVFFVLLLSSMNSSTNQEQQQASSGEGEEEVIPVQSSNDGTNEVVEDSSSVEFYANQYGVFTSEESALDFISENPVLNTSATVEVDGKYHVWSAVTPIREELILSEDPTSFAKTFKLSASACTEETLKGLPTVLENNDPSKFYFQDGNVPDNIPQDWQAITSALSSFSQDLGTARLHLIAHYFEKNDCMKIEF